MPDDKARGSNVEGEGAEEAVAGEIIDVAGDGKTNSCRYQVGRQWLLFGELGADAAAESREDLSFFVG
eukprot:COSAG01_NODE_2056_length_8537_cov_4.215607_2_plen_68_part_00